MEDTVLLSPIRQALRLVQGLGLVETAQGRQGYGGQGGA